MQSIADAAGVSRNTVSLALRHHRSIPARTRRRIRDWARKLGYRPNPLVSAWMAQVRSAKRARHTELIAFATAFPTHDGWKKGPPIFRAYFAGAAKRAGQLGYRLDDFWLNDPTLRGGRAGAVLQARGIHSVLFAPLFLPRSNMAFDWAAFTVATLGYSLWNPDLHRAAPNHFQIIHLAWRELKRRGYRRIGLALGVAANERVNELWLAGTLTAQQHERPQDRIPALAEWMMDRKNFLAWFRAYKPDAILTSCDWLPECIRTEEFRIPEEIGIIHLDWHGSLAGYAGVNQNAELVGAAAVDLIIGQLLRNERGIPDHPKLVMVNGTWVEGRTVRTLRSHG
jgi:LacI family transcriptional regulator